MLDLLVRGGTVVTPQGVQTADVAVRDGVIERIAPDLEGPAREEVDARGLLVLPGVVDIHVHFNEPGRTHWEGIATGSRALAAGGGTLFADMPLNSHPPVLDRAAFEAKRRAAEAASVTDFALWGGLVPGNLDRLPELAEAGVVGFKAFLCDSGLPEFPPVDDATLYEGMRLARQLGLPVAVHAENDALVRGLAGRLREAGRRDAEAYLASRPVLAEVEAVQRALLLARETGAALHVVHVSSDRAAAIVAEARREGVDVTLETCPHYLLFTDEDLKRCGAVLKCAPPLRDAAEQEALWEAVKGGGVDLVASDHSPAPPEMKQGEDLFAAWGGVTGVQFTLVALLSEGMAHGLRLQDVARLAADAPARRLRVAGKGQLAVGFDADLALVEPGEWTVRPHDLRQRHPVTPDLGRTFRFRVVRTFVRGRTVYARGVTPDGAWGRLVRPAGPHPH